VRGKSQKRRKIQEHWVQKNLDGKIIYWEGGPFNCAPSFSSKPATQNGSKEGVQEGVLLFILKVQQSEKIKTMKEGQSGRRRSETAAAWNKLSGRGAEGRGEIAGK